MIGALDPIPKPGELRTLPLSPKPNWRGVVAYVVGWFLSFLRWTGNDWARVVLEEYTQVIAGRIYHPAHKIPSRSLQGHESVHDWQQRRVGAVRYTLAYTLRPGRRRHFEAMAYGYEVAIHGRDPEERAGVAANPVYRMGWTRADARALIDAYATRFRETWDLVDNVEATAELFEGTA